MANDALIRSGDRRALTFDALAALALLAFVWAEMFLPRFGFGRHFGFPGAPPFPFLLRMHPPLAFLAAALCILPLALRRRFPVPVLFAVSGFTVIYLLLPFPPSLVILAELVALYTAGTALDRGRLALMAGICAAAVLLASLRASVSALFWADVVRTLALLAGAAALGDATRNRRAYVAEVERRAAEAESRGEEQARRRVDEERLRIARELHDITAHSLSIVAVQSGAALHVLDTDPAEARRSLTAIRETSRSALAELRAMLGVLRASGDAEEGAPLTPPAGLARLDDLARPLRDAGSSIDLDVELGADPLPAIVDASAFRIVQEALTNVLNHAGPAHVKVRVRRENEHVEISVADDGRSTGQGDEGHGIAGMRERALALGGTFDVGPVPGGGWHVEATLPLDARNS